jgi:metal-responsive CopG/Arc/MetJ family transcriptional regulator
VSLDAEVAQALKPAAERSGAASVSQYVEDTLRERIARETWIAR